MTNTDDHALSISAPYGVSLHGASAALMTELISSNPFPMALGVNRGEQGNRYGAGRLSRSEDALGIAESKDHRQFWDSVHGKGGFHRLVDLAVRNRRHQGVVSCR